MDDPDKSAALLALKGDREARIAGEEWKDTDGGFLFSSTPHTQVLQDDQFHLLPESRQEALREDGWQYTYNEGDSYWLNNTPESTPRIPSEIIDIIPDNRKNRVLRTLLQEGWQRSENGELHWDLSGQADQPVGECFLDAIALRRQIGDDKAYHDFTQALTEQLDWQVMPEGLHRPMGVRDTYFVPANPYTIARQAIDAANAGAAVVHLHTRNNEVKETLDIPGSNRGIMLLV